MAELEQIWGGAFAFVGAMVCNVGVYMVEIWVLSLFFNFFVSSV